MRNTVLQRRARALRNRATDAERYLWRHLRDRQIAGFRFRRQVPVAGFIADFACLEAKVIVELDGGQHTQSVGYDEQRDRLIEAQGFRVLRFWDNQVFQETQAVLEQIMRALESPAPHPDLLLRFKCSLAPQAGGKGTLEAEQGNGEGGLAPLSGEGNGEADLAPPKGEGN